SSLFFLADTMAISESAKKPLSRISRRMMMMSNHIICWFGESAPYALPEGRGVNALFYQLLQPCHHRGAIFGIGDTEPAGGCIEYLHTDAALHNEMIHQQWNEILSLDVFCILI